MNDGKVYAKDPKTGHYRYMDKKELKKGTRGIRFTTSLFYL